MPPEAFWMALIGPAIVSAIGIIATAVATWILKRGQFTASTEVKTEIKKEIQAKADHLGEKIETNTNVTVKKAEENASKVEDSAKQIDKVDEKLSKALNGAMDARIESISKVKEHAEQLAQMMQRVSSVETSTALMKNDIHSMQSDIKEVLRILTDVKKI